MCSQVLYLEQEKGARQDRLRAAVESASKVPLAIEGLRRTGAQRGERRNNQKRGLDKEWLRDLSVEDGRGGYSRYA